MKKKSLILTLCLIICLSVFAFVGCGKKGENFTVNFMVDNQTYYSYNTENFSGDYVPAREPIKDGYIFGGWFFDSQFTANFDYQRLGDYENNNVVTVYSKWVPNEFIVTFDTQGGSWVEQFTGSVIQTAPITSKDGYIFQGWMSGGNLVSFPYTVTESTTLVAKFEPTKINVMVYDEQGNWLTELNNVNYGTTLSQLISQGLLPEIPSKPGLIGSWNYDEDYEFTCDESIYINYTIARYTITLNYNGADGNNSQQEIVVQQGEGFSLPTPTKTGYVFMGWKYNGADFQEGEYTLSQDITLDALWIEEYDNEKEITNFAPIDFGGEFYYPMFDGFEYYSFSDLPNSLEQVDLSQLVTVSQNATWKLIDNNSETEITNKIADITISSSYKIEVTNNTDQQTKTYRVEFYKRAPATINYYNNGQVVQTVQMPIGELLIAPEELNCGVAGFSHLGWSKSEYEVDLWDFENDIINSEYIDLYAYFSDGSGDDLDWTGTEITTDGKIRITSLDSLEEGAQVAVPKIFINRLVEDFTLSQNVKQLTIKLDWKQISDYMFYQNSHLEKIVLPDGIKTIGESAFSGCSKLKSVVLPDGLEEISEKAFEDCVELVEINFPNLLSIIGDRAFSGCSKLKNLNFNNALSSIGDYAFMGCESVESVEFPNSLTYVGDSAFVNCGTLENVVLPNDLSILGPYIFANTVVNNISIPNLIYNQTEVFDFAYLGNSGNIKKVTILGGDKVPENWLYYGLTQIEEIELANSITTIEANAFKDQSSLKSIKFNGVKTIKGNAFENCVALVEIFISKDVEVIENGAFYGCTSVNKITFEDRTKPLTIGVAAFGLTAITEVEVPSVATINECFIGCEKLVKMTVPSYDVVYDSLGFQYNVETLVLTNDKDIGFYGFINFPKLKYVTLPNNLETIGEKAFTTNEYIEEIFIPKSVKLIDEDAFFMCTALKTLTFEEGSLIETIGKTSFNGAPLSEIVLPEGLKHIGQGAFAVTEATRIIVPNSVETIGENAFAGNYYTTYIQLPFVGRAIDDQVYLEYIFTNRKPDAGADFTYELVVSKATVIAESNFNNAIGTQKLAKVTYLQPLTEIKKNAFFRCEDLVEVNFNGFTGKASIDGYVFELCKKLEKVTGLNGLKTIGDCAFRDCKSLKDIKLEEGLESLGGAVFSGCSSLEEMTIPTSVVSMGSLGHGLDILYNCTSLRKLTTPFIGGATDDEVELYYLACTSVIEEVVVTNAQNIASKCFKNIDTLKSINLTAKNIGEQALYDCDNLETVVLNGTILIANQVFAGCDKLANLSIPSTIEGFGEDVILDCPNLTYNSITSDAVTYNIIDGNYLGNEQNPYLILCGYTYRFTGEADDMFHIDSSTRVIADGALEGAERYTVVALKSNLFSIGKNAFKDCVNINEISFFNNTPILRSIGEGAFSGTKITNFVIPDTVETIGAKIFENCKSLKNLTTPYIGEKSENPTNKHIGYFFGKSAALQSVLSVEGYALNNVVITKSDIVGEGAFKGYTLLQYVTLPECLTEIGKDAFNGCSSLISVTFGTYDINNSKLTKIGENAFTDCESLWKMGTEDTVFANAINLPNTVEEIGAGAFMGCLEFTSFTFPTNLKSLGANAFTGLTNLLYVYRGQNTTIKAIGSEAFSGCSELLTVELPYSVEIINTNAFMKCLKLSSITFAGEEETPSLKTIYSGAFADCSALTSLSLPNTLTLIGDSAFNGSGILGITIPDSCVEIGAYAFMNSDLQVVTIGENSVLSSIGVQAFANTQLETIVIPNSLIYLGDFAFENTSISGTSYNGGKYLGNSQNPYLVLLSANKDVQTFTVHNNTIYIYSNAFDGCSNLTQVSFGSKVKSLGAYAFKDCTSLTSITIPANITRVSGYVFKGCTNLQSVKFESGVMSLGHYTFSDCSNLSKVIISSTVETIGNYQFQNCSDVTVYCEATEASSGWSSTWTQGGTNISVYLYKDTQPESEDEGNYWHYENGVPTIWA